MRFLTSMGIQMILVSGTLIECIVAEIKNEFAWSDIKIIEQETNYENRMVHNIDFRKCWNLEVLKNYTKVLLEPLLGSGENNKRIVVFSMTKEENKNLAERIDVRVRVTINSGDSDLSMKTKLQYFSTKPRHAGPKILFANPRVGEGCNLTEVDVVVIVAGSYNGLVGMHQQLSRGSRGAQSGEAIHYIIYAPLGMEELFSGGLQNEENNTLTLFSVENVETATKYCLIQSIGRLFESENRCHRNRLEASLNFQISTPCNECNGCNRNCRMYPQIPEFGRPAKKPKISQTTPSIRHPFNSPQFIAIQLQFLDNLQKCGLCDEELHEYSALRFRSSSCNVCGSNDHIWGQVKSRFVYGQEKKNEEYNDELIKQCAVVVVTCDAFTTFKRCRDCFLSHGSNAGCAVDR